MATPIFFPHARVVERIDARGARTLRELLTEAGAPCRATGPWTDRPVQIVNGRHGLVEREPGDFGVVRVGVAEQLTPRDAARYVVAVLAYGLMDLVARESVRGQPWARPAHPRGRPARGGAQTNRERQRSFRARQRARARR